MNWVEVDILGSEDSASSVNRVPPHEPCQGVKGLRRPLLPFIPRLSKRILAMASFNTHLTVLEQRAAELSDLPALKVPEWSPDGSNFEGWRDVTFQQFLKDVERSARYWAKQFSDRGIEERSVIGIW